MSKIIDVLKVELKVKISLAAFPDNVHEVKFNFKLHIKEIEASSINSITFRNTEEEKHYLFQFSDITLNDIYHLNKLTFHLMTDDHTIEANGLRSLTTFPSIKYKWHVTNKFIAALSTNDFIVSPVFSYGLFEWTMKLFKPSEKQRRLYLYLSSLPSDITDILVQFRV